MAETMGFSVVAATHFRYHRWAMKRVFAALHALHPEQLHQEMKTSYGTIFAMLGHMYQADSAWWARVRRDTASSQPTTVPVPMDLDSLENSWHGLLDSYAEWGKSDQDWSEEIVYSNSAGKEFKTPAWELALHVVNHGSHHRGQIVGMIRQLGGSVELTDLILYYRLGCPE